MAEEEDVYQRGLQLLSEGRTEEAKESFHAVIAQQPEHAGAWLDLAILQCGMGMTAEAETLFTEILEKFTPPPAIQDLIGKIRAQGCQRQAFQGISRYQFRLGRGYDSNANQGASNPYFSLGVDIPPLELSPEFRATKDNFTQLGLESAHVLSGRGTLLYTQFQHRRHDQLSHYDLSTLIVGAEQPLQLPGGWDSRWGASLGATLLGNRRYQEQGGLHFQLTPPWPKRPSGWQLNFVGDWTRVRYPTLTGYDADITKFLTSLSYRHQETRFMGNLGVVHDFGENRRPGGDKQGWLANLSLRQPLGERLIGEFSWTRQDWQGEKTYSPGLIDSKRNQHTTLWRAALLLPLDARQNLVLEYKYLDNQENISIFRYQSRQLMLGWQYEFGD
ncbi:MAG: tetratricopeptide repeat protein [Zoogloeaceae bacterium]|jgi:hypothetical protein|nr:tetratricopeptide repeat protein [Zoogloeaceae bacterium]